MVLALSLGFNTDDEVLVISDTQPFHSACSVLKSP